MPPKRKASSENTHNTRSTKAAKKTGKESLSAAKESSSKSSNSTKPAKKGTKDTSTKEKDKNNASSKTSKDKDKSSKVSYICLEWPNLAEFIDYEDQDMPGVGEKFDKWVDRVSDLGIPVTEDGGAILEKLSDEAEKRDQDARDMYLYEDWNGWGVSEIMSNSLKDLDRDLSKKSVTPCELWAYVEGFACFTIAEDFYMTCWMGNENGPGVEAEINMIGIMVLTTLQKLSDHGLLKPDSEIKNIPIMCLLLLEFLHGSAQDFVCGWGCEVVRFCDEAGIDLSKHLRKQVSVKADYIDEALATYSEKKEASDYDQGDDGEGNGYKAFARKKDWKPQDDWRPARAAPYDDERLWYRWDWKMEYPPFKKNHPGGNHYDLTKKGKAWRKVRS
ncbi:hypothetical protein HYALB_00004904 [Hymenoscyphus albidus]|uniref:Uncharacterized protein n=1 Tax=Hymenoscyphus albidus TaxID=595503 RepID=A0A9N9LF71_9HELO|nr:hypothetical protein HYALB_00004904 [Hymenoscyphus albidus]